MKSIKLPFEKKDVHYDVGKGEVSLKREKFDELIRFVRDLLEEAQEAENGRDTARSRQRRAEAAADLLTTYAHLMVEADNSVRQWLTQNTIQELSRRSGIPYATCHRIVRERLQSGEVNLSMLGRILKAVQMGVR